MKSKRYASRKRPNKKIALGTLGLLLGVISLVVIGVVVINQNVISRTGLTSTISASETVRPFALAAIFRDHMVLQRNKPIRVWGTGPVGSSVTLSLGSQTQKVTVSATGTWQTELLPMVSGGPHTLTAVSGTKTITFKDIFIGEVWLCSGQSNMFFPIKSIYATDKDSVLNNINPKVRIWMSSPISSLKPVDSMFDISNGSLGWQRANSTNILNFSAVCFITGNRLAQQLNVHVGLIQSAFGGTPIESWISPDTLATYPNATELVTSINKASQFLDIPTDLRACKDKNTATVNSNSLIRTIAPFQVRGFIWYQGESNVPRAYEYRKLMPFLMADFRKLWSGTPESLPFYVVQLPKYKSANWAVLRDSQASVVSQPGQNAYMTINTDLGNTSYLHPLDKKKLAERLGNLILDRTYHQGTAVQQPVFDRAVISGNKIIVYFKNYGSGIKVPDANPLPGFELAGDDKIYRTATARVISGSSVEVTSAGVTAPKTVRYDWTGNTTGVLRGSNLLPVAPFRTDTFLLPTSGRSLASRPICPTILSADELEVITD